MDLRISLSPTGGLRLHIPGARDRTLDIPVEYSEKVECPCCGEVSVTRVQASALRTIKRILRNAEDYVPGKAERGHIGAFPTQEIIEAWQRTDAKKKSEDAAAKWAAKGVDVKALEFKL